MLKTCSIKINTNKQRILMQLETNLICNQIRPVNGSNIHRSKLAIHIPPRKRKNAPLKCAAKKEHLRLSFPVNSQRTVLSKTCEDPPLLLIPLSRHCKPNRFSTVAFRALAGVYPILCHCWFSTLKATMTTTTDGEEEEGGSNQSSQSSWRRRLISLRTSRRFLIGFSVLSVFGTSTRSFASPVVGFAIRYYLAVV